jgi:short-subunit dehydrogenase
MHSSISEMTDSSICKRIMNINYLGCVHGTIYALPYLKKSATCGKIGVVSSGFGYLGGPMRSGYCASKFALKGFFDSLRTEEPQLGITLVYPGVVQTEINRYVIEDHTISRHFCAILIFVFCSLELVLEPLLVRWI